MSNDDVIDLLNDLIENCKDGEYGFNACAEHAKSPQLQTFFSTRAQDCRRGAEELQAQVTALGGKPETHGTAAGAVHRGWVATRSALTGYDDHAMLEECERGEDVALKKYRAALARDLPLNIRSLVERQMQGTQRNHDEVKVLRDRLPKNA
ncbi:ferritin-like domain-containing protein [Eleftheria terrae]|uniref:ferritin-like domain-containing protein n=1 Tax=Eleftheria terrae TaxID=1597781 RepID=UPI00263B73BF|nr:PA2169 family four-helix-bundle protein [Eleftheria terrae]WKB51815.1 PA2169 family four-helix-bundle protein [Eleftheria terrae]